MSKKNLYGGLTMKLKRILASALVAVVAASAMAVSAMAAPIFEAKGPFSNDGGAAKNEANGGKIADAWKPDVKGIDLEKVDMIQMKVEVDSGYVNGFMGSNNAKGDWSDSGQQTTEGTEGTWAWKKIGGLAADDSFKVEFWWVNPILGEDPDGEDGPLKAPATAGGTVKVVSLKYFDAAGKELVSAVAPAPADTKKPEDTKKPGDDKGKPETNKPTGIDSVAAIAAVALIAGGAIVVSRKRK